LCDWLVLHEYLG